MVIRLWFLLLIVFAIPARASLIDYGPPQDAQGNWKFDLYDASGLQRGTSTNPLATSRTWSLLSSSDSVSAVQSGSWSLLNITGTVSLPTGASTSALQTAGNTTLTTISGQLPAKSVYSSKVISGNTSVAVRTGAGVLHAVILGNNASGGVINVYDGTSASGTLLIALAAGTPSGGLLSGSGNPGASEVGPIDVTYSTGLFVVTSGSTSNSFTVVYY